MSVEDDATQVLLALANFETAPGDPERGQHALEGTELEKVTGLSGSRLQDAVDVLDERKLLKRHRFVGDLIGEVRLNAQGRLAAETMSRTSAPEVAARNEQPVVDALALRRDILEELYKLNERSPQASAIWNADRNDPLSAPRAREAEYLKEKGLVPGTIGGHGDLALRMTASGRDYVEAGGFWSRDEAATVPSARPSAAPVPEPRLPRLDVTYGDKLGEGAFGSVWRAIDQLLERPIAVKFLTGTDQFLDEEAMLREARNLARLSHPNLVHVYSAAWLRHPLTGLVAPALTMELLEGEVLQIWWNRQHPRSEVFTAIRGLVSGLRAMHAAGLHHGDLHPRNVMVLVDGGTKLIDWRYQDSFLAQPTSHRRDLIEMEERRGIDFVARILEKQGHREEAAAILRLENLASVTSAIEAMLTSRAMEVSPAVTANERGTVADAPDVVTGFKPGVHADCAREIIARLAATAGHREVDVAAFVRESGRDSQLVRDVAEVMDKQGLVLRERMNKILRLTPSGREEAHRLGEDIPSPGADAHALLAYLMSRDDRGATADNTELTGALGFNLRRLLEAGELLEASDDATTDNSIGRMRITLSARNRIR